MHSAFLEGVDFQNGTAIFGRYAGVEVLGERYGSLDSRSERSSYIIAPWVGENGNIDPTTCNARPGVVSYYVMQNVFLDGEWRTLIMARVACTTNHSLMKNPLKNREIPMNPFFMVKKIEIFIFMVFFKPMNFP